MAQTSNCCAFWSHTDKIRNFQGIFRTTSKHLPGNIYLFKVDIRNSRKRCEICPKKTIKTAERRHWTYFIPFSRAAIDFEQVNICWDMMELFGRALNTPQDLFAATILLKIALCDLVGIITSCFPIPGNIYLLEVTNRSKRKSVRYVQS